MKINNRKSIYDDLQKYDCLKNKSSFIEITEWTNGEGWDITIDEKMFNLTYGELEAINYLVKALDYESDKVKNKDY
jgi:hypothetical protein